MVSPLDIGLLQTFEIIFPFLFILTVVFAFLTQIKPFKENYVYGAIIAISLAVLTIFFPIAVKTINLMAPWFVFLFIALMFITMAFFILGMSQEQLGEAITDGEYASLIRWLVMAVSLIIIIGSLTQVISEEMGFGPLTAGNATAIVTDQAGELGGFFTALLHPKLLGLAVILLVGFFAILSLSKPSRT